MFSKKALLESEEGGPLPPQSLRHLPALPAPLPAWTGSPLELSSLLPEDSYFQSTYILVVL